MFTNRRILLSAILIIALIGAALFIYFTTSPALVGSKIDPPKPMADLSLASQNGPVSLSDFRGKLVVLFFGFTECTDVCPLTLANFRQALTSLDANQAAQVQIIFVSVDWQRDTPEKMASYTQAFNPTFIGLTGTQSQIDAITKEFGIFYQFGEPDASGNYEVEHTSTSMVLNRQGSLLALLPYGMTPPEIASDLKILLRK